MKLEHTFTVPAPVDTVWRALLDPERVAPCFPGATVTSVSGDEFAGVVKVRLGPISLQYKGSGRFTEIDATVYRTVIEASGAASGGQSTAAATVTASLVEQGRDAVVTVQTNLSITGQPAQFGRGLLEDVGGKIIGQFADNLARSLGPEEPSTSASSAAPSPSESPVASAGSAASTEALPAAEAPAAAEAPRAAGPGAVAGAPASATRPAVPAGRSSFTSSAQLARPAADEIDLLDAAGGPVAKRLVPVLGGLVVLWLIIRWLRRR